MANQVTGVFSCYLRRKRIDAVLPFIRGKALDYGCGTGHMTAYFDPDNYLGADIDNESIKIASSDKSNYRFVSLGDLEQNTEKFDVVILLAVIEHVENHLKLLDLLKNKLHKGGKIIITTPHPAFDFIHTIGAKFGLFSADASDEHEELIDLKKMNEFAAASGLKVENYKRFLFGANQLFVLAEN